MTAPERAATSLGLDDLLDELQRRLSEASASRTRLESLLRAVLAIASDLDLPTVLRRITEAAATLADARYAALGVLGEDGGVSQFVAVGIDDDARARIGPPPRGRGVLGVLVKDPRPLRLDDLADHPAAVGFPAGHPPMTTFLGVPIRVRDKVFGNLYLTDKSHGRSFDDEDQAVVTALAAAAGMAVENARLYEAARSREGWLAASAEISTSLLSGTDPEDVLALVARRARQLCGAEGAFIALPVADHLLVEVGDGDIAAVVTGVVLDAASPCDAVFREGALDVLSGRDAAGIVPGSGIQSAVLVPLGPAGSTRGVLVVTSTSEPMSVAPATLGELGAFAASATVALQVAERRRDAERLTVLEDRDRIARDLHDLVIQRLFATGMQLESAARIVERPEAAGRLRRAVDDLDTTIREIRSTIYGLQVTAAEPRPSLRARLLEVVDAGAEQLGFMPVLRLSGLVDTSVPTATAEHLLAVVRETLSNAARHADARRVTVTVDVGDVLSVVVEDDGRGLARESARRSGLANLEDRARELGGTFGTWTRPAAGTRVVWSVPLAAPCQSR